MTTLSPQQIETLAPNEGVMARAKRLATLNKWTGLGRQKESIWGLCKGSGSSPYRCQVTLHNLQSKCTCPSRLRPCKHVLALLSLHVAHPSEFPETSAPDWQSLSSNSAPIQSSPTPTVDLAARSKRLEARMNNILDGAKDLSRWLGDVIRNGIAELYQEEESYWDHWRARMVDAQAPGLANRIDDIRDCFRSQDWPERTLDALGELYLLLQGIKRLPQLSPRLQEELINQMGISIRKAEVITGNGVQDRWVVLGRSVEIGDRIDVARTWLKGLHTEKLALILDFAVGQRGFGQIWVPGNSFEAELVYYPASYPLRAEFKSGPDHTQTAREQVSMADRWNKGLWMYAEALSQNPFLDRFPLLIHKLTPSEHQNKWGLYDQVHEWIPVQGKFNKTWEMIALSGGEALSVFGEWNGQAFLPLGIWHQSRWIGL